MPQATPAGKACGPCTAAKAACSLTGRAIGGSQSQADPESFRRILDEAVGSELRRLRGTIKRHTRILRELNGEVFARTVEGSVGREEWDEGADEERMVLENWRLWGQEGTGFEHLPVLTREQLFRADPEEEYEEGEWDEEEEEGGEEEVEVEDEEDEADEEEEEVEA